MRRTVLAAGIAGACALAGLVVLLTAIGGKDTGSKASHNTASVNLILNGNAGTGLCTPNGLDSMTIPGWTVTAGHPASVCYGAAGFPTSSTPGPSDRGQAFFTGGATGSASMWQQVDTSSARAAIDRGRVRYQLSGWLGGYASQADQVTVAATFRAGSGATLGVARIGPGPARHGITELERAAASGLVPAGTRSVLVRVNWTYRSGDQGDGYLDNLSLTLSTPVTAPVLTRPMSEVPAFRHVFFVFLENENYSSSQAPAHSGDYIVGNPAAPYLNHTIGRAGALLTQMYATTHPSDPNYLAVSGGSTFGWETNPIVGYDKIAGTNLGDRLEAVGKTWKGYAQGMSGNCDTTYHDTARGGYYLPDDEPFMLYADVINNPARCAAHDQPMTQFSKDLRTAATTPDFVWFAANDYQDMELGGVRAGDAWLARTLPQIFASPAWRDQRCLLIVSWDEGYAKEFGPAFPNQIATYVVASHGLVRAGSVSRVRYSDYSLGATIEAALGLKPLTSNDTYAQPVTGIWAPARR
jgi:hypothetical protein